MEENLTTLWSSTLNEIQKNLSKPSFETWLKTTRPVAIHEKTLLIEVPNVFTKDWLRNQYRDLVAEALHKVSDKDLSVQFVSSQGIEDQQITKEDVEISPEGNNNLHVSPKLSSWLNPKYKFESFVVGNSNRLAHAAALAVAEAPSKAYNPLFLYGGVGLGKTHLMHAIGHYVLMHNNSKKIVYLSSEKFTNAFINSIRDNKTVEFRNKYRNTDILLIDDIQFLAGKEQTQEEFFHTFNALHENNKQIIISSDRPPKEIPTLEDRLRSRFEWGLITDIHPPDLETRIAILHKKSYTEGIKVSDDVINFIAQRIETNIRELEGALIRVIAYSSLSNNKITLSLAEETLKDFFSKSSTKNIKPGDIKKITASFFNINPEDLSSKRRSKEIAYPRQIAMYLCRELTDSSLPKIGEEFGGKDHTTVMHACKKIKNDINKDDSIKKTIKQIKDTLLKL